jgi:hypothetical protein
MAVVVGLSLDAADDRVLLAAATSRHQETGKQIAEQERLEEAVQPQDAAAEEVIRELRGLYAKALNTPPLVEAVSDAPADE